MIFLGKVRLYRKSNIQHVLLNWETSEDKREYSDKNVMAGLKPHENLKEIKIVNFMGHKFASWITTTKNLVKVTFSNCRRCEVLPLLGHLPKLRVMEAIDMDNVKVIGSDFYGDLDNGGSKLSDTGAEKQVKRFIHR